jgi:hypothetical protein
MIRNWIIVASLMVAGLFMVHANPVSAASLKISPLRYDTTLASGEKQKGFVDVTNPSTESVQVTLSVQAFRQTNDSGALEFYDNPRMSSGVLLDYNETTLGPRETLHLAFLLDGTKLPSGDNFATIFATSVPGENGAGQQAVRVGTLLIINNGTPSAHNADIENLSGQLVQLGDGLHITFGVHNTAVASTTSGFSPMISITAWPYVQETVAGPLVFAGRTRTVDYSLKGNYLGLLAIHVKTGSSEQVIYRLAVTGFWRILLPIIVTAIVVAIVLAHYVRKRYV